MDRGPGRLRRPRRRIALIAAAIVLAASAATALITLAVSGGGKRPSTASSPPAAGAPRLFSGESVWNARVGDDAPVDRASAGLVRSLAAEVGSEQRRGTGPYLNAAEYSTPLYEVGRDQSLVPVALENPDAAWRRSLARAFSRVPLPGDARPAPGTDGHLTLWQPSTDRLWEFFGLSGGPGHWRARWGGAIEDVSRSPGYYTDASWPGASHIWGASATSLPVIGGTMLIRELQHRDIPHALAISVPDARAGVWAWPAQRSDGTSQDPASLPEGAHLRLDPRLDVSSLRLDPTTEAIAVAAQRYGMVVRDRTGAAIGLYGEDPYQYRRAHGADPYAALLPKVSTVLLGRFPWRRLQVLDMHLCREASRPCAPR